MNARPESATPPRSPGLDELLRDIDLLSAIVVSWPAEQRDTVAALRRSIDQLHGEAFARLIRALRTTPAAGEALRTAVNDDVIYAVLRHLGLLKPSLQERVEEALESVRPMLATHGGNVELVGLTLPDTVEIRLLGACDGCPASALTLSQGIEKAIQESCPEIVHIRKARGGGRAADAGVHFVSPFARDGDTGWQRVAALNEIPEAGIRLADLDGQSLLLSRFGDKVVCYQNACAHMGLPLDAGMVHEGRIVCPHHGFEYLLESGECLSAEEVQLHTHAVRVHDQIVEVKLL